ncbi:hypothetical protein CFIO01_03549 [Colletotrichum fioriniae PJ7]|uniref:Nephrocystin 3-like N-terminal domain-containing protein n=1 Tax=Colletotrichum fioriniae PJ7 TaxID=1445577 RepID=A0A010R7G6_9PEZI|nr:hypothetical protein CFIO01_03549 [Colletotrichum fioriniae PJ7]
MPLSEIAPGTGASGDEKPIIDIVAVHGLNPFGGAAHSTRTWTKRDRLWLRDDLPNDMPNARVLLYKYDSVPALASTKQCLTHEATDLLNCIEVERDQALVNAHNNPQYNPIKDYTRGLAFFATPHRGGNEKLVSYGAKCARVIDFVTNSHRNDLMHAVTSGSLYSDMLQENWKHQLNNYRIYSFYEGIGNIVSRDSATLNMPGDVETIVKIHAAHSDICRFDTSTPDDKNNYKQVIHGLRKLSDAACNHLRDILPAPPDTLPSFPTSTAEMSGTHQGPLILHQGENNMLAYTLFPNNPLVQQALQVVAAEAARNEAFASNALEKKYSSLPSFIKSFVHYRYEEAYGEINQRKHPESCSWIFRTPEMEWWMNSKTHCALWFTGYPGVGKSTLASHLVETLSSNQIDLPTTQKTKTLYAFCHHHENHTGSMILSIAIHQMIMEDPALQRFAFDLDDQECFNPAIKPGDRPLQPLWRLLCKLIQKSGVHVVFFVIDAYDLMDLGEQKKLKEIFRLYLSSSEPGKPLLKVFMTSNPFQHIMALQSEWDARSPETLKSVAASDYENEIGIDIDKFTKREKERIRKLQGYTQRHLSIIDEQLKSYQPKRFLPIALYFRQLETAAPELLQNFLLNLPDDIGIFTKKLVARLPPELLTGSSPLMNCVIHGFQALSKSELAFACRLLEDGLDKDLPFPAECKTPMSDDDKQSIAIRVGRYSPLLEIGVNNTVDVFHKSIRDFLLQAAEERENFCLKSHREAHRDLAVLCMKVITHKDEWLRAQRLGNRLLPSIRIYLEEHTFLLYAVRYWRQHLLEAIPPQTLREEIDKEILSGVQGIVKMWKDDNTNVSLRDRVIYNLGSSQHRQCLNCKLAPLEILSALGLDAILRVFIEFSEKKLEPRIWRSTKTINNAVMLAIQGGHHGCFDILRESFNISSLEGDDFKSVMADSTWAGRPELVETVLRLRRTRIPEFLEALFAAFATGDSDSLNELTRDRSIFRDHDHFGMSALHAVFAYHHGQAVFRGLSDKEPTNVIVAMCQYLIRNGMDPRKPDNYGFTPLHWACRSGVYCRRQVIECLVSNGANPRSQSVSGLTPLHLAAFCATNIDGFNCLLELGSNELLGISSRGRMTPLHWAVTRPSRHATFPHEDGGEDITEHIMRSLLQGGADIRWENSRGISVLQWAGRDRSQILQAIYSGLDGVQLIQIRHNANIGYSPLWQPWGDLETDSPGRLVPVANAPCTQIRQRDVEEVCETSEPQPTRVNLWIRIKRRLRLDQGKLKR